MNEAEYAQWSRLPHYVIRTHFQWAYPAGNESYRRVRRLFEYDELVQEATLGMLEAWENYDPNHESRAKFLTYATAVAVRKVARFISQNRTPVTTSGWEKASKNGTVTEKIAAALSCSLFSEMETAHGSSAKTDYTDSRSTVPGEDLVYKEYHDHCIQRLRDGLTAEEFQILMDKYSGHAIVSIGASRGLTRECTRQIVGRVMIKAMSILVPELIDDQ